MKTFSIIIPSYNSKAFISDTLWSIINADYDKNKIEVIIIDDGSTDGTYEFVNEFIKPYPYIKQIHKENGNWGSVINYVKNNKLVNHEIVSVLDSDDRYLSNTFNIVNQYIGERDVFAGAFYRFNGKKPTKKVLPYWYLFKRVLSDKKQMNTPFCLPLPFFIKKEVFYQLKDLREKVAFQDPDFLSQIMYHAQSLIFSKKAIGLYYFNRTNNSRSVEWDYHKRFEPELYACYRLIENNASECVSYRLNVKEFYQNVKKYNIKFDIKNKLKFKWFPWYVRCFYVIIYFLKHKKYFNKVN